MLKDNESKSKNLNVKFSADDRKKIKAKADKYTKGNVSKWVRWASTNAVPGPGDLADETDVQK